MSTGKSSEKTDVYGYGITLLQLITGQGAVNLSRLADDDDVMLLDWVSLHGALPTYIEPIMIIINKNKNTKH